MAKKIGYCERGVASVEMCVVGLFLVIFVFSFVGLFIDFLQTCNAIITLQEGSEIPTPSLTSNSTPNYLASSFASLVPHWGQMQIKKYVNLRQIHADSSKCKFKLEYENMPGCNSVGVPATLIPPDQHYAAYCNSDYACGPGAGGAAGDYPLYYKSRMPKCKRKDCGGREPEVDLFFCNAELPACTNSSGQCDARIYTYYPDSSCKNSDEMKGLWCLDGYNTEDVGKQARNCPSLP